jgi:hypothetical protein
MQERKARKPVDVYLTNKFPGNTLEKFAKFLTDPFNFQYMNGVGNQEFALARNIQHNEITQLSIDNFDRSMRIWLLKPDRSFGSIPIYEDDPSPVEWIKYSVNDIRNGSTALKPLKSAKSGSLSIAGAPPPRAAPPKRKSWGGARSYEVQLSNNHLSSTLSGEKPNLQKRSKSTQERDEAGIVYTKKLRGDS